MKIKFLIIPMLLIAFACQNTPKETTETTEQSTETAEEIVLANAQKIEINITGMSCEGCENAIQEKIIAFDGVYSTKADHVNGVAVMEFDSTKVNIANVKLAINDLGYEATDHHIVKE